MSATSAHPRTRPGSGPTPRSTPRRTSQDRPVPIGLIGPWQNALEGALSALCGVVSMACTAVVALLLTNASSVGSLGSLTMVVTAMAVGGSVGAGGSPSGDTGGMEGLAELFGGGGGSMSPTMSGAADIVPLGVTLVGAIVLWIAFARRLRQGQQRRFTGGELAVRAAGAVGMAMFVLIIVGALAHGTIKLPASAMKGMGGAGGSASRAGSSPFGDMGGGGNPFGTMAGGASSQTVLSYQVSAASAAFGALLWVAAALGVGCLISRRVRLPLGGVLDRLRPTWAPSLSAVVCTVVVVSFVSTVALTIVGTAVGGRVGTAAGAVLVLFPNLLAVFLSLGVGSAWTAAMHPVQSDSSNPMAQMMGGMGGTSGMAGGQQTDRTEHLRALSAGAVPLWLVASVVTGLVLVGCAYRAARVTNPTHFNPLHPYRGPLARHLGMAERFGAVTAVVLGAATWLAGLSGKFGMSMFGSEMGGMRAELDGSVLRTVAFGLVVGGIAGFSGSLLACARGRLRAV
ncbi:streptophobe family protein [Streptomyces sp. NPDC091280]|uniref:streptophobe family protein n=1 Tax=Streptomyces sp. NPDC091280 TaxID=3365984 RepID=UPI0038128F1C